MKRLSLLITMLVLAISQMSAQDNSNQGTITLSHNGKESFFAYNKMGDAVEAAADGDTIYLSNGEFEGDFRLTKKIAFIGSGADGSNGTGSYTHYYSGNIVVAMPEGTKLTARLFDGICLDNNITFQNAIENVIFRKCKTPCSFNINAAMGSLYFDRCYISCGDNVMSNYLKKLVARNCRISSLSMFSSSYNELAANWQFIHCTIDPSRWGYSDNEENYYDCAYLRGIFTNCIIDNYDNNHQGYALYNPLDSESYTAAYINCLFYKPAEGREIFKGATVQNDMYFDTSGLENSNENRIWSFTKEKLQKNNFLGNDGTVVGCWGGKNPYTLKPNIPTVSSSKVHLDKEKKQIQINIKLSSQQ